MQIVALTGGVASGKSLVAKELLIRLGLGEDSGFSCDDSVGELLTQADLLEKLGGLFGAQVLTDNGSLNREWLRETVFQSPEAREKLETLLHPLVLEQAESFIEEARNCDKTLILIEVPLLYEVSFPLQRDADVVVAASQTTQIERMQESRGLDENTALAMISAQLPIQEKINKADHVVWNDGDLEALGQQVEALANFLKKQSHR